MSETLPKVVADYLQTTAGQIMLEGAGLDKIWWRVAILIAWGVICFTLALRWFRWR